MGNFTATLPEWNAPGSEPPDSLKNGGWQPNQKPPADYFNSLQSRTYKALQELQQKGLTEDEIQALIDIVQASLNTHKNATSAHGATSAATPNTPILRDADGRSKVADPIAGQDIATKTYVDAQVAIAKTYAP